MSRVHVEVKDNDNFDKYMRIFKRACQNDGFIQEIRDRRYFLNKAEKRKLKKERARRGRK